MIARKLFLRCQRDSRFLPMVLGATKPLAAVSPSRTAAAALGTSRFATTTSSSTLFNRAASTHSTSGSLGTLLDNLEDEVFDDSEVLDPQSAQEGKTITTTTPFTLPPPSWSLRDLNLGSDPVESAIELSAVQVKELCAIAHIDLDPDGQGAFDAACATRDLGKMLRTMQTMRRRRGQNGVDAPMAAEAGQEEIELESEGPWGGAATWAAPLHEDTISDGGIQEDILGSADRTRGGFFTARRVVGRIEESMP